MRVAIGPGTWLVMLKAAETVPVYHLAMLVGFEIPVGRNAQIGRGGHLLGKRDTHASGHTGRQRCVHLGEVVDRSAGADLRRFGTPASVGHGHDPRRSLIRRGR